MRKIADYRKLLGATKDSDLKELKSMYRTFMKDWHPDKFHADQEKLKEAEEKSKSFIEAYHFLVSIAPETRDQELPEYTQIINSSRLVDFEYKAQVLTINFLDGSAYEYFDIPRNIYTKFLNSDTPDRFARRHIYHSFVYRKVTKAVVAYG